MLFRILSLLPLFLFSSNLPKPYADLKEVLPFTEQNWFNNPYQLARWIKKYRPDIRTIVEIGSWTGHSTCFMASLLPEDGLVYAVDHWLGSIEHQPGSDIHPAFLPKLYEVFLSNVIHRNLAHKIIPVRMDSVTASKTPFFKNLNRSIDLIYIDGDHSEEGCYNDLEAWFPYVKGHGVLCGDDYTFESVQKAIYRFASKYDLKVIFDTNFWVLSEKRSSKKPQ